MGLFKSTRHRTERATASDRRGPTTTDDPAVRATTIEGISLEAFARISQAIAARPDGTTVADVVSEHGIGADAWERAVEGWNARMQRDAAVSSRFAALYRSR